jgi:hypothetical protein
MGIKLNADMLTKGEGFAYQDMYPYKAKLLLVPSVVCGLKCHTEPEA